MAALMRFPARWLLRLPSALGTIFVETAQVTYGVLRLVVSGKQPNSTLHLLELPPVPRDASDDAYSAWITGGMSVAPNGIVIGVDPKRRRLLISQLVAEKRERPLRRAEKLV
jgi:hypothetical protein